MISVKWRHCLCFTALTSPSDYCCMMGNNIFCWFKEVTLIHWKPANYQTLTHGVYPTYLIIPPDNIIPNNKVISLSCYLSGCKNPVPSCVIKRTKQTPKRKLKSIFLLVFKQIYATQLCAARQNLVQFLDHKI